MPKNKWLAQAVYADKDLAKHLRTFTGDIRGHLENPDGSMKIQSIAFQFMPLIAAIE
jgi:hypothetical protein